MTKPARLPRPRAAGAAALLAGMAWLGTAVTGQSGALGLTLLAVNDSYSVRHDHTLTIAAPGVLGNDVGLLGSPSAVKDSDPTHGSLTLRTDGGFTYVPAADYVGTDSFRYHARDGLLGSLPATVTITVTNAAPVAKADSYSATTGVQLSVPAPGVKGNDTDADGDALTVELIDGGGNGSLDVAANGSFTFTSGGSLVGNRTFTYRVSDGITWSSSATVTIAVSSGATPTPRPTPTPTPRPTPTPTPRPTPTPTATAPPPPATPTPTPQPTPTARPGSEPTPGPSPAPGSTPTPAPTTPSGGIATPPPSPAASDGPSASPDASAGASAGPGDDAPGGSGGGSDGATGSGRGAGAGDPGGVSLGGGAGETIGGVGDAALAALGGLPGGLLAWSVPALLMGVPGILLLLIIGAQALGALAWLPVVRRRVGGFGLRERDAT